MTTQRFRIKFFNGKLKYIGLYFLPSLDVMYKKAISHPRPCPCDVRKNKSSPRRCENAFFYLKRNIIIINDTNIDRPHTALQNKKEKIFLLLFRQQFCWNKCKKKFFFVYSFQKQVLIFVIFTFRLLCLLNNFQIKVVAVSTRRGAEWVDGKFVVSASTKE